MIYSFDKAVFLWIEDHLWCSALDVVFKIITQIGDAGIVWIVLAVVLLFFKKTRKAGATLGAALLIMMLCNDMFLKDIIARPRPYNYAPWAGWFNYPDIVPKLDSFSFPSGHTASSITAATVLLHAFKKKGIPALVLALLISFSRIYVHVHYCTDVLAGAAVGVLYGIVGILLVNFVWKLVEKILAARAEKKKSAAE